nr:unnamed protein product [Digitaria exilis]
MKQFEVLPTWKMADEELAASSKKKRVADTQINKDNPEPDDDGPEPEMGTFKKASVEVMATRKIVKVRRQQPSSAPSSNPFSAIRFTPTDSSAQASAPVPEPQPSNVKPDEGSNGSGKDALSASDKNAGAGEVPEIQKDESAVNRNSGATTEAPHQPVETSDKAEDPKDGSGEDKEVEPHKGNNMPPEVEGKTKDGDAEEKEGADETGNNKDKISKDDTEEKDGGLSGTGFSSSSFSFGAVSKDGSSAGTLFGLKTDGSSFPSFNLGANNSTLATSAEAPKKFAMTEGPVETGEENEKAVFTADSALTKGNYRLVLNASLYDDMSLKDMDKKGVTFACMNSIAESQSSLATFALKFKDTAIREEFKDVVEAHKTRKEPARHSRCLRPLRRQRRSEAAPAHTSPVFNYTKGEETVTEVDSEAFRVCNRQGNMINEWSSGNDVVSLDIAGRRWFFSSLCNHCDLGLKLVVDVELIGAPEPGPAPSTPLPPRRRPLRRRRLPPC